MFRSALIATALLATVASAARADDEKPYDLMVGDPAPELAVGSWVKGQPVASFQRGQVYVVEFWATWCGPCRRAIPHVSELQKKYGDAVRFIGVSIWESDPSKVEPFVQEMGSKMEYTVAKDRLVPVEGQEEPRGAMAESWMRAAGQSGIPTAFIVGRDGRISWIGHPMEIEEPLAKVVAGEWDRAAFAAEYAARMRREALIEKVSKKVYRAMKDKAWDEAVALIDGALEKEPGIEGQFATNRFLCLVKAGRTEEASRYGNQLVGGLFKNDPGSLNYLAWSIVDPEAQIQRRDVDLAMRAARRACDLTEWKEPALLDTLAVAVFLSGDHERAVEIQTQAVEHAIGTPFEKELESRLEEFKRALEEDGAKI